MRNRASPTTPSGDWRTATPRRGPRPSASWPRLSASSPRNWLWWRPAMSKESGERLAFYMRVSSEEQAERMTIGTQEEFLDQYCALYGHEVADVYKDEAISGTVPMDERPEGRRLLDDAKTGVFGTVLVYRLDRVGRSLLRS